MTEFDQVSEAEQRCWGFIAESNDRTLVSVFNGTDVQNALKEFDRIRDEGISMVTDYTEFQNEVECRRLEYRLYAAFHSADYELITQTVQELGASQRLSRERAHEMIKVIGGLIKEFGRRQP